MKTILLHALALITALLPFHVVEAAPKPPAVIGGFEVGRTFTFTVNTKSSASGVANPAPIPKGVPDFAIGQQVTFTIGKKGELVGPGIKFAFTTEGGTSNVYNGKLKAGNSSTGIFGKNLTTGGSTGLALYYTVAKKGKGGYTVTQITYTLNP